MSATKKVMKPQKDEITVCNYRILSCIEAEFPTELGSTQHCVALYILTYHFDWFLCFMITPLFFNFKENELAKLMRVTGD